jgi:hypothetical protein
MTLLTFAELHAEVAAFHAAEAARNTPAGVARRAIYELRAALADLTPIERREVFAVLADEILLPRHDELRVVANQQEWAVLAARENDR